MKIRARGSTITLTNKEMLKLFAMCDSLKQGTEKKPKGITLGTWVEITPKGMFSPFVRGILAQIGTIESTLRYAESNGGIPRRFYQIRLAKRPLLSRDKLLVKYEKYVKDRKLLDSDEIESV